MHSIHKHVRYFIDLSLLLHFNDYSQLKCTWVIFVLFFFTVVLLFQTKYEKIYEFSYISWVERFQPNITVSRLALSRVRHSDIIWGVPSSLGHLVQCVFDSGFFDGHIIFSLWWDGRTCVVFFYLQYIFVCLSSLVSPQLISISAAYFRTYTTLGWPY